MMDLRLPQPALAFLVLLIMFILSTAFLIRIDKYDLLPQLWVSLLVAFLAYWATYFTSERLRLDLFDKRFEIYERVIEFSAVVLKHGSLRAAEASEEEFERAINAAHESFKGIGCHKAKALFGDNISELVKELNDSFTYIMAAQEARSSGVSYGSDRYYEHVSKVVGLAQDLPGYFRPYIYFGDYKRK